MSIRFSKNILFLLIFLPMTAGAETIYKSIDDKGQVSYSTTPPVGTEQATSIDILPPPSEKDIKAAHNRQQRNKETAEILDENRKKREKISSEENQLKHENQKQMQLKQQAENNNDNQDYGYPYIPGRRVGGTLPPAHRPIHRPISRPVQSPRR